MGCLDPTCTRRVAHRHHVVYKQELERRWKSGLIDTTIWPSLTRLVTDPRNLADVCHQHHFGHHDGSDYKMSMALLPDEAVEFAFEALGAYAYDYLRRRYAGEDPRLESHLAAAA